MRVSFGKINSPRWRSERKRPNEVLDLMGVDRRRQFGGTLFCLGASATSEEREGEQGDYTGADIHFKTVDRGSLVVKVESVIIPDSRRGHGRQTRYARCLFDRRSRFFHDELARWS
ncbi:MAG: hypothetical protein ACJAYU_001955 [Bradymonadia bacterium]